LVFSLSSQFAHDAWSQKPKALDRTVVTVVSGYYDKDLLKYGAVALVIKVLMCLKKLDMEAEGLSTMSVRTKLQAAQIRIP